MFLQAAKSHGFGMSKTGTNMRWEGLHAGENRTEWETLCQDPIVSHSPDRKETKAFLYPSAPASQGRDSPKSIIHPSPVVLSKGSMECSDKTECLQETEPPQQASQGQRVTWSVLLKA